jgi:general secretion pathway protein G
MFERISTRKGFTLIELLVVISIVSMLSTVVISSLGSARTKARNAKRYSDLLQVRTALELYAQDHGGLYPLNRNSSGIETGVSIGTTPGCSGYTGAAVPMAGLVPDYLPQLPQDPKPIGSSNCYVYMSSEVDYKFMVFQTMEFDTPPSNLPLGDPHLTAGCATPPSGTKDRTSTISVYSTYDPESKVDTCW